MLRTELSLVVGGRRCAKFAARASTIRRWYPSFFFTKKMAARPRSRRRQDSSPCCESRAYSLFRATRDRFSTGSQ